jgi:hypothetical protein
MCIAFLKAIDLHHHFAFIKMNLHCLQCKDQSLIGKEIGKNQIGHLPNVT